MGARRTELLLVALVAAALTIALTWPIAGRLGTAGRVDSGDGRYSAWNVAWVAHALTTDPRNLYNTNIFWPRRQTLAYSEPNLVAGVLGIPTWLATGNAVATWNSVILLSFVMAALAMYALMRHLVASRTAAAFSTTMFTFCPFVFGHIPHVQLLLTFGLPLVLLCLHRFVEAPTAGRAAVLGGALAIDALSCGYYGVFGALMTGYGLPWFAFATGRWRDRRYWSICLLAALVAIAAVFPFFIPFLAIKAEGFGRTLADARIFSADWRSYLASPLLIYRWVLPFLGTWRDLLFPGLLSILFAAYCLWRTVVRRDPNPPMARSLVLFYTSLAALAFWASFGPDAGLYTLIYETTPFLSWLRAPTRFGILVTVCVAILGGAGLSMFARLVPVRRHRTVMLAILLFSVSRSTVGPIEVVDVPTEPAAYRKLRNLPVAPVAEFPYYSSAFDRHRHTEYMLVSTTHWKPLLNGYSDFMPAEIFADMERLDRFPDMPAWQALRTREARFVVIHWSRYDAAERLALATKIEGLRAHLHAIHRGDDASLYEIVSWPSETSIPN